MRYSIVAKGMSPDRVIAEAEKTGARNITRTKLLNGVFCELDEKQARNSLKYPV